MTEHEIIVKFSGRQIIENSEPVSVIGGLGESYSTHSYVLAVAAYCTPETLQTLDNLLLKLDSGRRLMTHVPLPKIRFTFFDKSPDEQPSY